ncbi:transposase [Candidatus Enterovibrio altilux]|nr:transposase [Candidatus Enterovibrio luxaltus]
MSCSQYLCVSKRVKTVNVAFKMNTKRTIQHLAIDFAGLKTYGEDEWQVKKHDKDSEVPSNLLK